MKVYILTIADARLLEDEKPSDLVEDVLFAGKPFSEFPDAVMAAKTDADERLEANPEAGEGPLKWGKHQQGLRFRFWEAYHEGLQVKYMVREYELAE